MVLARYQLHFFCSLGLTLIHSGTENDLPGFADSIEPDQPAHLCRQIRLFTVKWPTSSSQVIAKMDR